MHARVPGPSRTHMYILSTLTHARRRSRNEWPLRTRMFLSVNAVCLLLRSDKSTPAVVGADQYVYIQNSSTSDALGNDANATECRKLVSESDSFVLLVAILQCLPLGGGSWAHRTYMKYVAMGHSRSRALLPCSRVFALQSQYPRVRRKLRTVIDD